MNQNFKDFILVVMIKSLMALSSFLRLVERGVNFLYWQLTRLTDTIRLYAGNIKQKIQTKIKK